MFVFSFASNHLIKEKILVAPEKQHMCAFDESVVVAPSTNPAASTSNVNRNGANLNEEGVTSSLGSVSASATSRDKGKCKRSEKGSAKHQKKQTKKEKHHDVFNEELDTEDNNEVEDEEDTESSSEEEIINDDDEELPNTRSRKGTQETTMDPLCFVKTGIKSPASGNTVIALSVQLPESAMVDRKPVIQLSGPTSIAGATPLMTGLPPPRDESTSVAGAAPLTANLLKIEHLEPLLAVALPPADVKWPWFGQAYTQLASGNFGPAFSAAILKYIELEECTNFGVGVVRAGFKKTEVEGFLNVTHHGHLHGEDGWACLHRHE